MSQENRDRRAGDREPLGAARLRAQSGRAGGLAPRRRGRYGALAPPVGLEVPSSVFSVFSGAFSSPSVPPEAVPSLPVPPLSLSAVSPPSLLSDSEDSPVVLVFVVFVAD